MSGSLNDYSTWIRGNFPSEIVTGIGMGADGNKNIHTSTVLEYELYMTPSSSPSIPTSPSTPAVPIPADEVPDLVHPIRNPAYRQLSQRYGENPNFYSEYKIDGVPLRGHEGLDFMTPEWSEIVSVDNGIVTEAADQGNEGYGKYIKVVHDWGETVYAHLNSLIVKVGDRVQAGQLLGYSGNTGNSSGPHLHFGMRKKPYNRKDGMGGYIDPVPYLQDSVVEPPITSPQPMPPPSAQQPEDSGPGTQEILGMLKEAAEEFDLDWRLLASLVHAESSFDPKALNSYTDARGLGQITPIAEEDIEKAIGEIDVWNPKDNLRGTAYYLKWCIKQMGTVRMGLWAYQMGVQAVKDSDNAIPLEVLAYASKIIHGREMLTIAGVK
jgi:murein DD-endopeptidase MepM/ murein hydrolase activator NlpD